MTPSLGDRSRVGAFPHLMQGLSPLLMLPQTQDEGTHPSPFSHMVISIGWNDLYDAEATWPALVERLSAHSMDQILFTLGKVSTTLWLSSGPDLETQAAITAGLFGRNGGQTIMDRLDTVWRRMAKEGTTGRPVLFHQQAVATVLKAAMLHHSSPDEPSRELDGLGECLLMATSLATPATFPEEGEERDRALELYAVANGLYNRNAHLLHEIARAYDLFVSDKPQLADHPGYVDIPDRFERASGLPPEQVWTVLVALAGHWGKAGNSDDYPGGIARHTYFTEKLDLTASQSDRFFDLASSPLSSTREAVSERYALDGIRPYDTLAFARRPLVEFDGRVYCPLYPLLFDRLIRGLHHFHLDDAVFTRADRQRYLDYLGHVFEDYVHRMFWRMFPPTSGRYISGDQLAERLPSGKVADGAIVYGDRVVVLEFKATQLSVEARTGEDWAAYERQTNEIFVDALAQLAETCLAIHNGALADIVPPVHKTIPLVVTLEEIVMMPLVHRRLSERAEEAGVLFPVQSTDWQHLTVGDLELLEVAIESGTSLADLLEDKTRDPVAVGLPLVNYCHLRRPNVLPKENNPYLGGVFDRLGDSAVGWVRGLQRS